MSKFGSQVEKSHSVPETDAQSLPDQRLGILPLRARREDLREIEVGLELVWVGSEFLAKGLSSRIRIAGVEERLSVKRLQAGKAGIQLDGAGQLLDRGRKVFGGEHLVAQQEPGFGGVSFAQDAVNVSLSFCDLSVVDEGSSQEISNREFVGVLRLDRGQQLDHIPVRAHPQLAIGQQENRLQVVRRRGVAFCELTRGFLDASRLVVSQAEVTHHVRILRIESDGLLVFRDGLVEAP